MCTEDKLLELLADYEFPDSFINEIISNYNSIERMYYILSRTRTISDYYSVKNLLEDVCEGIIALTRKGEILIDDPIYFCKTYDHFNDLYIKKVYENGDIVSNNKYGSLHFIIRGWEGTDNTYACENDGTIHWFNYNDLSLISKERMSNSAKKEEKAVDSSKTKTEEEIKMVKENAVSINGNRGFEGFDFRKMLPNMETEAKVSMSLLGNGVVSKDGTETIYYTKEDGLSSLPFVGMVMSPMVFPCHITKIKEGDMILHNKNVVIVINSSKTKIKVVNPQTEAEYDFVPKKNFFIKEGFVAKVMTFDGINFDGDNMLPMMMMMGGNNTMQGNMMLPMMMMMSGKDNDMEKLLPMLMMMGGDQNQMLPMMMMMQDSDDMSSMLPMMMMIGGSHQQQQNPMMMLAMMSMLNKDKKNKAENTSATNIDKEEGKE